MDRIRYLKILSADSAADILAATEADDLSDLDLLPPRQSQASKPLRHRVREAAQQSTHRFLHADAAHR